MRSNHNKTMQKLLRQSLPWRTILVTVPIVVWINDTFGSVYRVNGSSMEPTLRHGDIIVVRKCEWGIVPEAVYRKIVSFWWTRIKKDSGGVTNGNSHVNNNLQDEKNPTLSSYVPDKDENTSLLHSQQYEQPKPVFYNRPAIILDGQIVILKHPNASFIKPEKCVKRVIGVGGQWVQIRGVTGSKQASTQRQQQSRLSDEFPETLLQPNTLYVEGDNLHNSCEKLNEPITQSLVIGIAEYIIWPASRQQRIYRKQIVNDQTGEHRSRWS